MRSEQNPLLTVITATFNSEETIEATINSLLKQTVKPFEYIVVDGLSQDKTMEIVGASEVKFKAAGIKLKCISERDEGIYDAWNKALRLVEGEWVAFLGSDDLYVSNALELYRNKAIEHPDIDFITAKAKLISGDKVVRQFGEPFKWETFKREMKILHAGGFLNVHYFKEHGTFDQTYKITGDYELLLRKGKKLKVSFIDQVLVHMGADGVSSTHVASAFKEARRARVKNKARNTVLAYFDYYWVMFKIKIKMVLVNG